jgi:hypothetical protein
MDYIDCAAVPINSIYGDAPARLDFIGFTGTPGAGSAIDIYGAYIAFRSSKRHGTLANFVPLWELEDGSVPVLGSDTAAATQAGASPDALANNCMETDFSTAPGFGERVYIEFSDVTANFSDNYGRFVVLYRGQVDAATSCTVRVDSRLASSTMTPGASGIPGTAFTVDNSSTWRIFDTGLVVQFQPTGTHTQLNITELYGFTISASQDTGVGSLYSDCLILVPIDEYMLYYRLNPIKIVGVAGEYARMSMWFGPDDSKVVYEYTWPSNLVMGIDIPYTEGAGVPPGYLTRAYFVIFDSPDGDNTLTPNTVIKTKYYPRYHSLQGAT